MDHSQEIDRYKKIHEQLKASEEKYRTLIEMSTDAIVSVNEKREITQWNRAASEIFGYSCDEALGCLVDIIVPEKYRQDHIAGFNRYIETGAGKVIGKTVTLEGRHKDGTLIPIELSLSVINLHSSYTFTGIIRDITSRVTTEKELSSKLREIERSKKDWETTFDAILEPMFIHDREFRVLRCNRAYQVVSGLSFQEIINAPYYKVFPKMEKPHSICLDKFMSGVGTELEEEVFLPDTDETYRVRAYPYKDNLNYSVHIMENITELKNSEALLKHEVLTTSNLLMIAEATAQTTDINNLISQVSQCCCKVLDFDICLFYLWDRELKVLRPVEHYGLANELSPLFKTEILSLKNFALIKQAFNDGAPIITGTPVQSFLRDVSLTAIIPLSGRFEKIGIITGIYLAPKEIEARDISIMKHISHHISVALEEARLYKDSITKAIELSQKIETIQIMHEIDRGILSTLNKDEILETVTLMISRIISCDRATIVLVDREKKVFTLSAGFGIASLKKNYAIPFKDTMATEVLDTGRPQFISNYEDLKDLPAVEKMLLDEGFKSHIRVPISVKGTVIGILTVGSKRLAAFSPEALQLMENISVQIAVALENSRLVTDLEQLFMGTIKTLSQAIDAKSPWTMGHSERVTDYAIMIAEKMGIDDKTIDKLRIAGLLHDIGKIGTYDIILDKPGRLTEEEFKIVKNHPGRGAELLSPIKQLKDIIPWIKHHHERYDGKGYPDGLKGDDIPLEARILTVADTFDSMTAKRPYRETPGIGKALEELKQFSGAQFDPEVVKAFIACCEEGDMII